MSTTKKVQAKRREKILPKKHKLPFDDDDDNSEDDNMDILARGKGEQYVEFDDHFDEELQVVFDVCAPDQDKDFFGIELYLKNYLNGTPYETSELTNLMLEEMDISTFTSVIKIPQNEEKKKDEDEDMKDQGTDEVNVSDWEWNDIYGVISLIDYSKHKKKNCVKQIRQYILDKCTDLKLKEELKEVFENGKLGIVINERVLNMPSEVAPQLHQNLFDEINEAIKEDSCTFFKHYLLMTRVYFDTENTFDDRALQLLEGKRKKKKQKQVTLPQHEADAEQTYFRKKSQHTVNFFKPEEELFYVRSKYCFSFPLASDYSYDDKTIGMDSQVQNEGLVMVVEREKVPKILKRMQQVFLPKQQQQDTMQDQE